MGTAVVLIFGTQRDVLRAWMSCCRRSREVRKATSSEQLVTSSLESQPTNMSPRIAEKIDQDSFHTDRRVRRKSISTRDISFPVVREDLTFPYARNLKDI